MMALAGCVPGSPGRGYIASAGDRTFNPRYVISLGGELCVPVSTMTHTTSHSVRKLRASESVVPVEHVVRYII